MLDFSDVPTSQCLQSHRIMQPAMELVWADMFSLSCLYELPLSFLSDQLVARTLTQQFNTWFGNLSEEDAH